MATVPLATTLRLDYGIQQIIEADISEPRMPERAEVLPTGLVFEDALEQILRHDGSRRRLADWVRPTITDEHVLTVPGFNDGLDEALQCMEKAAQDARSAPQAAPFKRAARQLREIQALRGECRAMFSALFQG
ncbi:MAG: hypothetical protein RIR43_1235 [Pseudomonadota bacterium]|jgi:hypothetical protein